MTMMLNLLAQATQPAWKFWGPAEWVVVISAISAAVCAVIASIAALRKSDRAETNSVNANANASAARTSADHAGNIAAEARGMTSATPTILVPPPAPTPEAIASGLAANQSPENKP
jgi:hypothetical protein